MAQRVEGGSVELTILPTQSFNDLIDHPPCNDDDKQTKHTLININKEDPLHLQPATYKDEPREPVSKQAG